MNKAEKIIRFIDKINEKTGAYTSWLTFALVILICFDVFMRYVLNYSNVSVQELEWHIFAVIFLMGAAYTMKEEGHVRVDVVYSKLSQKKKAWVDLFGFLFLFLPFCLIVFYSSFGFVMNSFNILESSPDPGGLPARFILKIFLPVSFGFLLLQGISLFLKSFLIIKNKEIQ